MVTKCDHRHIILQAVYIQTISMPSGVFKPYAFTFQSGYIQIRITFSKCRNASYLYIPIWLYSNLSLVTEPETADMLYIPIWLYSNIYKNITIFISSNLYIPIWLYSNSSEALIKSFGASFTLQSGYIQMVRTR